MDESQHWSNKAFAAKTDIPLSTVRVILRQGLKMKKLLGKRVPHELTHAQLEH